MTIVQPVFRIIPTAQTYDWGKVGRSSKVAQFAVASRIPGFQLDENKTYAELWMGTHPKSPSRVLETNQILSEYLAAHPQLIGEKVLKKFDAFDGNLPYLFKVLSIEKALSIQTHPDKATAEKLHADQPDVYKDPNHKPEMALALTDFSALCGFLPLPQVAAYLGSTPEFSTLIPPAITQRLLSAVTSSYTTGPEEKAALKDLFSALMTSEQSAVEQNLSTLVKRYESGLQSETEKDVAPLVLRINEQFPGDIGVFCAFVLNYIQLRPGEAIFLGAGEPHAYVTGDIMECMANSDNVIRAGLTPKLRDIPNLISGLTYTSAPGSKHMVKTSPYTSADSSARATLYDPPIPEFSVLQIIIHSSEASTLPAIEGPSIAIVTEGSGKVQWGPSGGLELSEGHVIFIGAGVPVQITAEASTVPGPFTIYRAFVEASPSS